VVELPQLARVAADRPERVLAPAGPVASGGAIWRDVRADAGLRLRLRV